jgi:hypothetical protein
VVQLEGPLVVLPEVVRVLAVRQQEVVLVVQQQEAVMVVVQLLAEQQEQVVALRLLQTDRP